MHAAFLHKWPFIGGICFAKAWSVSIVSLCDHIINAKILVTFILAYMVDRWDVKFNIMLFDSPRG